MKLTWLGHSGFELTLASGEVILFDPWLENPKYPAGHAIPRADAILISHGHNDHSMSAAALAKRHPDAKVVGIVELTDWLESNGTKNVIGMNKGGTADLGFARVTLVAAQHSSSFTEADGKVIYLGEPCGFVVEAEGKRLYFAGDTSVFGDMRLIAEVHGPIDVSLLPIGDHYTMGPKEASYACRLIRPKLVVPMHWGTFPILNGTPEALARLIADLPSIQVLVLTPGAAAEL